MLAHNNLRCVIALLSVALLLPSEVLQARTRKGDKFLKLARAAELRKEYEQALDYYNQALSQDPADPAYELGVRRTRFQVSQLHVEQGQKLRQAGMLEEALAE